MRLLIDAVSFLLRNFRSALVQSALLYTVIAAAAVMSHLEYAEIWQPLDADSADSGFTALLGFQAAALFVGIPWVAAVWFRTVLGGASAQVLPAAPVMRVMSCIGLHLALSLIGITLALVPGLAYALDVAFSDDPDLFHQWRTFVYLSLAFVAFYYVLIRGGVSLAGSALGEKITFTRAFYATEHFGGAIIIPGLLTAVIIAGAQAALEKSISLWVALPLIVLSGWLEIMLTLATIAVLYIRCIEGRPP